MEKISVIIPAYNSQHCVGEAIESALAQTYPVSEIIVVDDGSTDNTAGIVSKYIGSAVRGPRPAIVKYIRQENRGPAAARNAGIRVATGRYIALLDSDDLWLPKKLEKQMAIFTNSNYAMVYCDMSHVVDGKVIFNSYLNERDYAFFGNGDVFEGLLKENFVFTPTVIIKKEVLEKMGYFDESYRICEDYKMWLAIARNYPVGYADEVLVTRRRTGLNVTKDKLLYASSLARLFKEMMKDKELDSMSKSIIGNKLKKIYFDLGYWHWKRKNVLRAIQYVAFSFLRRSEKPCRQSV